MQPPENDGTGQPPPVGPVGRVNLAASTTGPGLMQAILFGAIALIIMIGALLIILSNVFRV